jgi:Fe2+ or Zn2+ uptake regulation protein
MGRKGKVEELGLQDLIAEKWDGGKKTIVWVTAETNQWLQENGYKVTISREGIRRAIKTHEEQIDDARRSMEAAKTMAEVLKDYPATEASEAMLMKLGSLISTDLRTIDSINFEDPVDMIQAASKLAETQMKLSNYRTKAIDALEKAKRRIKEELQKSIQSDPELLDRLCSIVDSVEVK